MCQPLAYLKRIWLGVPRGNLNLMIFFYYCFWMLGTTDPEATAACHGGWFSPMIIIITIVLMCLYWTFVISMNIIGILAARWEEEGLA